MTMHYQLKYATFSLTDCFANKMCILRQNVTGYKKNMLLASDACRLCVQMINMQELGSTSPCSCFCSECYLVEHTYADSRSSSRDHRVQMPAAVLTLVLSTVPMTRSSALTTLLDHQQWRAYIFHWCTPSSRLSIKWQFLMQFHAIFLSAVPKKLHSCNLIENFVYEHC